MLSKLKSISSGYVDGRSEDSVVDAFDFVSGEVSNGSRIRRVGAQFRVALENTFQPHTHLPNFNPTATPFSKFVSSVMDEQECKKDSGEAAKAPSISTEEILNACKNYNSTQLRFRYQHQSSSIEWGSNLGDFRTKKKELSVVRITLDVQAKGGKIFLRQFVHSPTTSRIKKASDHLLAQAILLQGAVEVPSGKFDVVLDPSLASVLVHELFGHALEMDQWAGNHFPEVEISNPSVTVEDLPHEIDSPGFLPFDDEGVSSKTTTLIHQGVRVEGIHSLTSAFRLGRSPNGKAQSSDFRSSPKARMTNICLRGGEYDPQELIQNVKNGYYLIGSLGGISSGPMFQVGAQYGYRIQDGKLTHPVVGKALGGETHLLSRNFKMIGNDMSWVDDGGCLSEEQYLLGSGRGSPHVLLSNVTLR